MTEPVSTTRPVSIPEVQSTETALEDIVTRESTGIHNPMLHLAFGCACLMALVVVFAVGLVLLIWKTATAGPSNTTEAAGVIDKYSINRISTPSAEEVREASDKSYYAWPFDDLLNLTAKG
ncbi:hypothetical protein MTO96_028459 [Rhipicephalus appendiculatus]